MGGFGYKGPGIKDDSSFSMTFKKVLNKELQFLTVAVPNSDGTTLSLIAPGDSGGGVYRKNSQTNAFEVVGVNSSLRYSGPALEDKKFFRMEKKTGVLLSVKDLSGITQMFGAFLDEPYFETIPWLKSKLPAESFSESPNNP